MALIDELEKEGYDTSQITPELIASLEKEGYDVSPLQKPKTLNPNRLESYMNEPGLQDVSLTPITENIVNQTGVDATEKLASKGGWREKVAPYVGTTIQVLPDILMTLAGFGGAKTAAKGTQLGRVISGPGRKAAGEAIGLAEKTAGIQQTLPELKQLGKELGMKNTTPRQYVQRLFEKAQSGFKDVPLQKLAEHEEQLGRLIDKEPKGFLGSVLNSDKSELGKKGTAVASKTRQIISDAINKQVPERAEALANYGAAKTRGKIYKGVGASIGGAIIGSKGRKVLKTIFGSGE